MQTRETTPVALGLLRQDGFMKRAIIVHGYQGEPMAGWRPWMKRGLEARGWKVSIPAMPNPNEPRLDGWVAAIGKEVGRADADCYLVGHSLGCIAILRYLEKCKGKVGGALLVAGFVGGLGEGFEALENFFKKPVDWKSVKGACPKMVAIFSDNDPYVPLSQEKIVREKLGAKTIVLNGRGHFSSSEGVTELPEALEELLGMLK